MADQQFKYLFSPIRVGSITLKNRLVTTAHSVLLGTREGVVGDDNAAYYADKAKGGFGLIVMEASCLHATFPGLPVIYDDRNSSSFKKITDAVHEQGGKIFAQVCHFGKQMDSSYSEAATWSSSPVPTLALRETPHEMEVKEIREVVQLFARGAKIAKEAGFDGIEIHSVQAGYLISQFLCPRENKRTDEYGGTLENRMRFLYEVIDAIREEVGSDYVVGMRISGDHFEPGGLTLEDTKEIVRRIADTGKIDYIGQSMGTWDSIPVFLPDMRFPLGAFAYLAAGIREAVEERVPIIATGRITDPILAEKILADGSADLIGMAKESICDPEFPLKAQEGRLEDIRHCVGCMQGCIQRVFKLLPVRCVQNPAVGKERELGIGTLKPASVKKKVLVVGGGPAGLKAAEIAARRGHDVTLCERENELGGQVNIATRVPSRMEFGEITKYLTVQVQKLKVKILLGVEMTFDQVASERFDSVVVATGSTPLIPSILGVEGDNVVTVWDVLRQLKPIGENVVVVDGGEGHWECLGTAEFLADEGKRVELITPSLFAGMRISGTSIPQTYQKLLGSGVVLTPNVELQQISGDVVATANVYSGEERRIEGVDTVVLAYGKVANNQLYKSLEGKVPEVYCIGDCYAPRLVDMAIREGEKVGRLI